MQTARGVALTPDSELHMENAKGQDDLRGATVTVMKERACRAFAPSQLKRVFEGRFISADT